MKRRRFFAVVLLVCMCAAVLAGCAPKLEQIADEELPLAASAGDDYASWGKTEWESASDAEKDAVCVMVLRASEPALDSMSDAEILEVEESIEVTRVLINQWFMLDENETIGGLIS